MRKIAALLIATLVVIGMSLACGCLDSPIASQRKHMFDGAVTIEYNNYGELSSQPYDSEIIFDFYEKGYYEVYFHDISNHFWGYEFLPKNFNVTVNNAPNRRAVFGDEMVWEMLITISRNNETESGSWELSR